MGIFIQNFFYLHFSMKNDFDGYFLIFVGVTEIDKIEIVDRHNYHRANVDPPAANMLKMVKPFFFYSN